MCIKIESLLGVPSRQTRNLKTQLRYMLRRIDLLRRKHQVQCSQARDDVAQLLLMSEIHRALRRAEQVVREQNALDIYNLVETYCNLIIDNALLFDHDVFCPEELFEAVSGLIYASPRCGDLPELRKVRHIFIDKYGMDFIKKCGISPQVIEIFSKKVSIESMKRVTLQIASDQGIKLEIGELLSYNAEENQTIPVKIHPAQIQITNYKDKEFGELEGLLYENSDENMKNIDEKLKRKTLSFGKRIGVSVRTRRPVNN